MNRSHRGSHFVSEYVSVPVGKDHTGGQRKLQESVTVAVGVGNVASSVRTKRRKMEGAHGHSNLFYC